MSEIGDKLVSSDAFGRKKHQCEGDHYEPIGVRAARRQRLAARAHVGLKPMRFVSLHHHSTFSFLDGFQLPEAHVRRATEINMGAIAMTEHGNIFSHVQLERAAEKQGVKPLFGCEFYVGWTDKDRRTQRKNHLTVLAKNQVGYANLLKLVSMSWKEGFYYEPTVDWQWLVSNQEGLVVLSGCQGSALFTACVGGKHVPEEEAGYKRGLKVARWMGQRFDDFYIEVQAFPELDKTCKANPMLARIAKQIGRPLVATMDCHYTAPEEAEVQQVLHNTRPGEQRTLEDLVRDWGYDVPLCHPPTDRVVYRRLRGTGLSEAEAIEAIVSTEEIAQECNVTLPKLPKVQFPLPSGFETATELWRHWLKQGWKFRGCHKLPHAERERYKAQLAKEMEVIEAKGYENYFLIVSDSVKYAKDNGVPVGPARGSAAASLACWLLRITEVNPMLFDNLVFERFIDWSREDMPDVDLDFDPDGRPKVRDYLVSKYGEGCVNNIGTFTYYKSKLALDDVARVHQIPKFEVEKVKELLIERSSGDLRASATIEDTIDQFDEAREVVDRYPDIRKAMDLEGNVKGFGVHAAGLVISDEPITNVCAILEREVPAGSGNIIQVVSMDKYDCERQGLEKLDYLALGTMGMVAEALRQLGMELQDMYDLPLDDPRTIEGFRCNDVTGIFQFEGRAMRSICGALKPDNFKEICDVNALSRPGPLHNGAANAYIDIKRGVKDPELIHPALDDITQDTNYQIVYQEQILRIVKEIGNFDWTHAAYIRRIISKKLGEQEFARQWEKFRDGATTLSQRTEYPDMTEATAEKVWGLCITSGSYAFNAAHSTGYGMLGYWTMWLKQHHPAVFYAASLAKTREVKNQGVSRHQALMRDAAKGSPVREPIEVLPPRPGVTNQTWERDGLGAIRAGLTQLPGVSEKTAAAMLAVEGADSWQDYQAARGIGPKKVQQWTEFSEAEDPFNIYTIDQRLQEVRDDIAAGKLPGVPMPTHRADEVPYESGPNVKITFLGVPVHRNLRDIFESNRARTGKELKPDEVKDAHLNEWVMILCTDGDEQVTVRIDRWKYPKFKKMVWGMKLDHDMLLVEGVKPGFRTAREVYVKKMWILEP